MARWAKVLVPDTRNSSHCDADPTMHNHHDDQGVAYTRLGWALVHPKYRHNMQTVNPTYHARSAYEEHKQEWFVAQGKPVGFAGCKLGALQP